jgi:small subunit ribosomal protein S8
MLKQHYNKEFFHLISSIKKMLDKNHEILSLKITGNHSTILQLLLNEGFITSFQSYNNFVVIRAKYNTKAGSNSKQFGLIELTGRISRRDYTVSLKDLLTLQRREGGAAYYVLNTDKGLLTSFNAIDKRVGGQLLLKIS